MKIDKYCAILGNAVGYHEMDELTANRPLATLPFDGKYRLIDFQLSNLINADIHNVYAIFHEDKVNSVLDHIRNGREWGLNSLLSHLFIGFYNKDFNDVYADDDYYEKLLTYLKRTGSDYTIFSTCDILCNINLSQVIHVHTANKRKMTVVYKRMANEKLSSANQILEIDDTDTVVGASQFDPSKHTNSDATMSAGTYVVSTDWLIELMEQEQAKAEPRKLRYLLSNQVSETDALAYEYTGYLANIHDVKTYYDANMDMLDPHKFNSLLFGSQKVYTKVKNEEATYYSENSRVENSQFASGSIINGSVLHSIISRNCLVDDESVVKDSILFPKVKIGKNVNIEYAIIDKSAEIADNVTIKGTPEKPVIIGKSDKITEDIKG
ncbi:glucose-1-phosphate adenylyltransferase subunit GlgD [Floricoccus penangensis]|uniref:Glucose-1-phosphate adenylyltransferase subunit GlgD n=1 Tax=Floricoccus penangensis TaxID=1859475 RepID=A0A9Q5P027_9LACT|nr:glucose-1-phosphate adenylyltransferase subunit GlgD [Floricoccus penangensis]OFI47042.1 glucose-1-phosphate adenylyltransferase subunit GlgD [Floricoccus penangensis]